VATGDFQGSAPRVKILLQEGGTPLISTAMALRQTESSK
jgi:hypothetical protein